MPCREDQIKDFPWTPQRVASLLKYAQEKYPHADLVDTVKGVAADLGRSEKFILEGLTNKSGVSKPLTTEMWTKQFVRRNLQAQARNVIDDLNKPQWQSTLDKIYNTPRRIATAFHWTVFPKTHGGDFFLTDPKLWGQVFLRSAKLATAAGRAEHEARITGMKLDPDYPTVLRMGVDVAPGGEGGATFRGEAGEILGSTKPNLSSMAFDELRLGRFELAKRAIANLSQEERADTAGMRFLGETINHPTGSAKSLGPWAKYLLFAPRLLPATFKAAFVDPVRAAKVGVSGGTAAERAAAKGVGKRLGVLFGVQAGALALNAAYSKISGNKDYMPNLTEPGKASFLRPKIAGYSVPISPTTEILKLPIRAITAAINAPTGQGVPEAGKSVFRFLVGKENPALSVAWEGLLGEQAFSGRPLPQGFPSAKKLITGKEEKPSKTRPRVEYSELIGSHLPIAASNYVTELYDGMRESGLTHPDAKAILRALVVGTIAAPVGLHLHKTTEYEKKSAAPPKRPF
jgi:hypothetical protein